MIAIVDYGMGNVASVKNALALLGVDARMTAHEEDFNEATHIIFPGVGAYPDGMQALHDRSLVPVLKKQVFEHKKPFLGICLGMQLLSSYGEEGSLTEGLSWIEGTTRRLKVDEKQFRLPHIGWDDVTLKSNHPLFKDVSSPVFYFVHSYVLEPKDPSVVIGTTEYGEAFTVAVQKDNIYGVQFHPEKSQASGLQVLKNFISL